jgi:hypothetical protein
MSDPTVQTTGGLAVSLKNLTNCSGQWASGQAIGITLAPPVVTYGPPAQPPPAWTSGTQYTPYPGIAPMFGSPQTFAGNTFANGLYQTLWIPDLSSQAVVPGKLYYFAIGCSAQTNAQLYLVLSGGTDGTTVLPGFGLYNLITAPRRWTYLTPQAFTGEYSLDVNNPAYAETLTLSVRYQPPRWVNNFQMASRLAYSISGGTYGSSNTGAEEATSDDELAHDELELDIARSSDAYHAVEEPAAAVV